MRAARARLVAPFVALAFIAALSGCSLGVAGHDSDSSTPTPGTSPSSSPAAASGDDSGDAGTGPFPCSVFPLAYIKRISGYDIVKTVPITAVNDANKKSCEYVAASGHSIGIETAPGEGAAALQIFSEIEGTGGPVSGIGDSAWGNDSELAVVFGDDYVNVTDDSDVEDDSAQLADIGLDTLKQMVLKVHAGMG